MGDTDTNSTANHKSPNQAASSGARNNAVKSGEKSYRPCTAAVTPVRKNYRTGVIIFPPVTTSYGVIHARTLGDLDADG